MGRSVVIFSGYDTVAAILLKTSKVSEQGLMRACGVDGDETSS